ncbi:MAG: hypothetical protein WA840_03740 [Caulobacteraceae bacterium]
MLTNAVHSIEMGVEDFRSTDPRRLVSAVRNVQAGILLLCKEKLRQISPPDSDEVLIKQRIVPELDAAGQLIFKGQGDKTVDENQVIERFTQLGLHLDWTPLRKLTRHRNVLEHYRFAGSREELREVVAQSAIMIRQLFDVLGMDPVEQLELDCWEFLLENEAVFGGEFAACKASSKTIQWWSPTMTLAASEELACESCHSELLTLEDPAEAEQEGAWLTCRACTARRPAKAFIWNTLRRHFGQDLYEAATQGGVPPLFKCSDCGELAVVVDEGTCAACGRGGYELRCEVCNEALTEEDLGQSDTRCQLHLDTEIALFAVDRRRGWDPQ